MLRSLHCIRPSITRSSPFVTCGCDKIRMFSFWYASRSVHNPRSFITTTCPNNRPSILLMRYEYSTIKLNVAPNALSVVWAPVHNRSGAAEKNENPWYRSHKSLCSPGAPGNTFGLTYLHIVSYYGCQDRSKHYPNVIRTERCFSCFRIVYLLLTQVY